MVSYHCEDGVGVIAEFLVLGKAQSKCIGRRSVMRCRDTIIHSPFKSLMVFSGGAAMIVSGS